MSLKYEILPKNPYAQIANKTAFIFNLRKTPRHIHTYVQTTYVVIESKVLRLYEDKILVIRPYLVAAASGCLAACTCDHYRKNAPGVCWVPWQPHMAMHTIVGIGQTCALNISWRLWRKVTLPTCLNGLRQMLTPLNRKCWSQINDSHPSKEPRFSYPCLAHGPNTQIKFPTATQRAPWQQHQQGKQIPGCDVYMHVCLFPLPHTHTHTHTHSHTHTHTHTHSHTHSHTHTQTNRVRRRNSL